LAPWELAATGDTQNWIAAAIPKEIAKFVATIEARQRFTQELNV
jgi:hypothetical protein